MPPAPYLRHRGGCRGASEPSCARRRDAATGSHRTGRTALGASILLSYTWGGPDLFRGWNGSQQLGEEGGPVGHTVDVNALVEGVRTFADGAETVEGRDTESRGEIAVGAATAQGLFQFNAEFGGGFPREMEQAHRSGGALHRGTVQPAGDFDGAALVKGAEGAKSLFQHESITRVQHAHVDFNAGLGGHDVGTSAAADDAGVDGDAAPEPGERGDALDLAGQLDHGAGAGGVIKARMRRPAADNHGEAADAFARGLQFAGKTGAGLENEDGVTGRGVFFRQGTRGIAANLLIGIELKKDAGGNWNLELAQGEHGKYEEDDAGFHIVDAGAPEAAAGVAEGHRAKRAHAPDGIGVAEREDAPGFLFAGQAHFADQVLSEPAAIVCANIREGGKGIGDEFDEAIYGDRIIAGRFALDEAADQRNHFRFPLAHIRKNPIHGCYNNGFHDDSGYQRDPADSAAPLPVFAGGPDH